MHWQYVIIHDIEGVITFFFPLNFPILKSIASNINFMLILSFLQFIYKLDDFLQSRSPIDRIFESQIITCLNYFVESITLWVFLCQCQYCFHIRFMHLKVRSTNKGYLEKKEGQWSHMKETFKSAYGLLKFLILNIWFSYLYWM